jgi:uncharacterized membrane protein YjjP (DUF1212 family)
MYISARKITHHLSHYLPLIGILVSAVLGFSLFPYDKGFQFAMGVAAASGYISWGLIHHYLHRDLHGSVVLEYLAVAILGVVILFFTLFRA